MAQKWFKLSADDGGLKPSKEPARGTPLPWKERHLENLTALNPAFLEVEDQIPLRLGGVKKPVGAPDQAFLDELGRITLVEFKKVRASLPVLAQVIAYALHWQILPPGEMVNDVMEFSDSSRRLVKYGNALAELIDWSAESEPKRSSERIQAMGAVALRRLRPQWIHQPSRELPSLAKDLCECVHLPCVGAAPRLIVLAQGFSDECIEFAQALSKRRVSIDLVAVEVVKKQGSVFIGREWVQRDEYAEPTWKLLRDVMANLPIIPKDFLVNGWADALNYKAFSLSARGATDAKFWMYADRKHAYLTTTFPHGWYSDDGPRRKILLAKLQNALPTPHENDRGWLEWTFDLTHEQAKIKNCITKIAEAVIRVLVPAAKDARARGGAQA
jgi:hypothetical protein